MGWMSDFTKLAVVTDPVPNIRPNFGRILSLVKKILVFEIAEPFFDFYVGLQGVAHLISVVAGSATHYTAL